MVNLTETEKEKVTKHINECIGKIHNDIAKEEALDGDQTEWIARLFHLQLDLVNGNLTDAEFQKKIEKLR